jgi:hypothetical protein
MESSLDSAVSSLQRAQARGEPFVHSLFELLGQAMRVVPSITPVHPV